MKDTIRKVQYFKVMVPNRPGSSAKVFAALADAGVNLLAFSGFPCGGGRAQLDFVPENANAFKKALRKAGVTAGTGKFAFLVQGADRPGAAREMVEKLAQARINITASTAATAGEGRYGAILWVKPNNVAKAKKVLGAS